MVKGAYEVGFVPIAATRLIYTCLSALILINNKLEAQQTKPSPLCSNNNLTWQTLTPEKCWLSYGDAEIMDEQVLRLTPNSSKQSNRSGSFWNQSPICEAAFSKKCHWSVELDFAIKFPDGDWQVSGDSLAFWLVSNRSFEKVPSYHNWGVRPSVPVTGMGLLFNVVPNFVTKIVIVNVYAVSGVDVTIPVIGQSKLGRNRICSFLVFPFTMTMAISKETDIDNRQSIQVLLWTRTVEVCSFSLQVDEQLANSTIVGSTWFHFGTAASTSNKAIYEITKIRPLVWIVTGAEEISTRNEFGILAIVIPAVLTVVAAVVLTIMLLYWLWRKRRRQRRQKEAKARVRSMTQLPRPDDSLRVALLQPRLMAARPSQATIGSNSLSYDESHHDLLLPPEAYMVPSPTSKQMEGIEEERWPVNRRPLPQPPPPPSASRPIPMKRPSQGSISSSAFTPVSSQIEQRFREAAMNFESGSGLPSPTIKMIQEMDEERRQSGFPPLALNDIADRLTYDIAKLEIDRTRLKIVGNIASGEFGLVQKAQLTMATMSGECRVRTVAVKRPINASKQVQVEALRCEMKLLAHLGPHQNIVTLVGAVTSDELWLVLEYCDGGSLVKFLFNNRSRYQAIDSDDQTGSTLGSTFSRQLSTESVFKTKRSGSVSSILSSSTPATIVTLTRRLLVALAQQVANGMEFIHAKRCVHRDLAARNILVNKDGTRAKITDFGMAKDIYNDGLYQSINEENKVPWRWYAPEFLRSAIYLSESDVWSFGVVLWEILSLGELPYNDARRFTSAFVDELENGRRLTQPKRADDDLYELMKDCWQWEPHHRPNFQHLNEQLLTWLETRQSPNTSGISAYNNGKVFET